jgi:class 3 adenylate cyclase/tetratricopeptide (TPR) repeat protein
MKPCPSCGRENPDDARFCAGCGTPLLEPEPQRSEVRKTVTVLFSDVTGSTALGERLDPESLRRVMSRYFDVMSAAVERHGATVEKFIGDAIMAVFGLPLVHEDDAFRAVRAAAEMRDELAQLNDEFERDYGLRLENRTGINTGEVVAGDSAAGQRLVTGDAVNVAARLEQAADPGQILVGESTYRLVRDAVEALPVEPLSVKGKTDELSPLLLIDVLAGAEPFTRRLESKLVGRERELDLLRQAYRRAGDEQSCHLFTILGTAGIGKSRIAQEFLAEVGDGATVVSGRCLSYGEGITYWPLVEILEQLGNEERLVQFLEGEPDARSIVNTVLNAIGQAQGGASPEEIPWAVRKLLEALAREQPLVVVFDDLQWAEPTFLDLVEHVADFSRDASMLLLCIARPELLDDRPGWSGGKMNATSILLEPLSEDAAETLIENLIAGAELAPALRERVAAAAEGNPLFVEQMLAMLAEDGAEEGEVSVPPTIQALLAARLDRLGGNERAVIERAAVMGKEFWFGALAELVPEDIEVAVALALLVRKELIRPYRSSVFPTAETFRFRHQLIRDAAYAAMAKELRAELHERFADWLEGERSEFDEIVGYHLEQAFRYRSELGPLDHRGRELGSRAGARLAAAGRRALARADMPAAAGLLRRSLGVLPTDDVRRTDLRLDLADALAEMDLEEAEKVLADLIEDCTVGGDRLHEWRGRMLLGWIQLANQRVSAEEATKLAQAGLDVLTELADDVGLARAWRLRSQAANLDGNINLIGTSMRAAAEHARRAGNDRLVIEADFWIPFSAYFGDTPLEEARTIWQEVAARAATPLERTHAEFWGGCLAGLGGDLDEGISAIARARARYHELGMRAMYGGSANPQAELQILANDPAAAEKTLRDGLAELEQLGDRSYSSTLLAQLAEALYEQGRLDAAADVLDQAESLSAPDDAINIAWFPILRAKVVAGSGRLAEAERLAREGVERSLRLKGHIRHRAYAREALADVLKLAGRSEEARAEGERALELYEQKGLVPAIEQTRSFLAELVAGAQNDPALAARRAPRRAR